MASRPLYFGVLEGAALMGLPERPVRRLVIGGRVHAHRCGTQPLQVSLNDLEKVMRDAAHLVRLAGYRAGVD